MNCVSLDPAYKRVKDHVTDTTGLVFLANREIDLIELIGQRLSHLQLLDCSSYADFLAGSAGGPSEMEVLIEQLTIGETYFFRDTAQFTAIREIILPDILERNKSLRQLRILSAGCASGAEPYSLAILLMHEMAHRIAGWQVSIDARDLNRNCLALAEEGKFREWALRATSDRIKHECFSHDGLIWTIHPRYRQWISFQHMNLAQSKLFSPSNGSAHFDLILCRNVMIYFAPETKMRLVRRLYESLGDGGWLMVGAVEHDLEAFKEFRNVTTAGAKVYQKSPGTALPSAAPLPAAPIAPLKAVSPAAPGRYDLEGLRQLADRGDWKRAADYGRRLVAQDRMDPMVHFFQALIFENLGMPRESERSLRRAIYLDRNFALAHYHLGLALKRDGHAGDEKTPAAARSFVNVVSVLASLQDHTMVRDGREITAVALRELAWMQLERGDRGSLSRDAASRREEDDV